MEEEKKGATVPPEIHQAVGHVLAWLKPHKAGVQVSAASTSLVKMKATLAGPHVLSRSGADIDFRPLEEAKHLWVSNRGIDGEEAGIDCSATAAGFLLPPGKFFANWRADLEAPAFTGALEAMDDTLWVGPATDDGKLLAKTRTRRLDKKSVWADSSQIIELHKEGTVGLSWDGNLVEDTLTVRAWELSLLQLQ